MKRAIFCMVTAMFVSCSQAQVIAEVNGSKISLKVLKQELKKLPEATRQNFENDYPGFLEELITRELLLQEAKALKIDTIPSVQSRISADKANRNDIVIEELFKHEVLPHILVSEDEMKNLYNDNKSQMQGLSYDQMKPQIKDYLTNQKQIEAINMYISELHAKATIVRNEQWLKAEESKLKNPINDALKNSLPTMVDFGATGCLPCTQMKPILEELQREYKNLATILFINVKDEPVLARKYKIMLIPTQIFYDTKGNEIYRHVGFYPKDSIVTYLEKAGL